MTFDVPLWYLSQTNRPILLGPWTSEMGFEALYWLPFVEQLRYRYKLDKERLIAITRGGAGAWYDVGHTVELFDYVPPQDLRLLALQSHQQHASIKQLTVTPWERRLVDLIAVRLGLRRYHVLHPSRLYQALDPWWRTAHMGMGRMLEQLRFTPIQTPVVPVGMALPERFIAVRFYQRPTWPLQDGTLEWTQALIRELAKTIPVVILTASQYLDDHVDFPAPTGPNIHVIQAEPWRDNLAVQSAVLKRAAGFVGTWGGMAQLAVRLGIPTAAFYLKWGGCSYQHKVLTEWLGVQSQTSVFVGRPHDLAFARSVVPAEIALPEMPRGSSS